MSELSFQADLELYGPDEEGRPVPSLEEARRYCRRLARRHYENFSVGGLVLPREAHRHVANVYAYCRWADDLADETGDSRRSLDLLDWWEGELDACYAGRTRHPVFIALAETIRRFEIPRAPFADLLRAFRQDQTVSRYETFDDVLGYCRNSADPVGRLVLYLARRDDSGCVRLSDSICTGLQLANFCQDVARDWRLGRVYLPLEDCRRFGVELTAMGATHASGPFRELLAFEVDRAEQYLQDGMPLVGLMPRPWRLCIALFVHGGLKIVDAIRRRDYDVLSHRPVVSKLDKLSLLASCWWRSVWCRAGKASA